MEEKQRKEAVVTGAQSCSMEEFVPKYKPSIAEKVRPF